MATDNAFQLTRIQLAAICVAIRREVESPWLQIMPYGSPVYKYIRRIMVAVYTNLARNRPTAWDVNKFLILRVYVEFYLFVYINRYSTHLQIIWFLFCNRYVLHRRISRFQRGQPLTLS